MALRYREDNSLIQSSRRFLNRDAKFGRFLVYFFKKLQVVVGFKENFECADSVKKKRIFMLRFNDPET